MTNLTRRTFMSALSAALCVAMILPLAGCPGQNETAALIAIVGQSVATVATIQGDANLAAILNTSSAAAIDAVKNWKQGQPADQVTQAINVLLKNINLIPVDDKTKIYISLAVTTVNSILAIIEPAQAPTGMTAKRATKPLVTAKAYKAQWNSLTVAHPSKVPQLQ